MATFTGTNNPLTNPKQAAEKFKNQLRKRGGTYRVQGGDSWFQIAGEIYKDYFGGDVVQAQRMAAALAAANPDIANLRPGMRVNLPMPTRNPYVPANFGGTNNQTAGAGAPPTVPTTQANPAAQPAGSAVQYPSEARYTAIANAQRANTVAGAQTLQVPAMPTPPRPVQRQPLVTPQARNPQPVRVQPIENINQPFSLPGGNPSVPVNRPSATTTSPSESRYTYNPISQAARNQTTRPAAPAPTQAQSRPQQYRPTFPAQTAEARQRASVPAGVGTPTAKVVEQIAAGEYPAVISMYDIPAILPMEQFGGPFWYTQQSTRAYVDAYMQEHGYKRSEYGFYIRMDAMGDTTAGGGSNPYYTGYRGPGTGRGGGTRGGGGGSYGGYGGSYGPTPEQLRYANESGLVTWRI